jgi:outer membrane autotransporter protein
VALGSKTLTLSNASTTYNGVISGIGGGLTLAAGTQTLAGTNTYTGATTINGGTLQAGLANTLSTATAVTVASGAIFNLNSFNQSIGSLAGAGGVTFGSAMLTTGNDGSSTTFSGVISGTGALDKVGAGTFIVTNDNTYGGGTTINAGTLQLGDGGTTGSIVGNVTNNGILAVQRSNTLTLSSDISGNGSFQQNGTGTTILTGSNAYSGTTTVNSGALIVNGSIGNSSVTVNSGALIGGNGTVGPLTINGGTLAAGNSIGQLNVQGNLVFTAAATYLVEVDPNNADKTTASGTASLAGTVRASFASGVYFTRSHTILTSASLGGTQFSALDTANLPAGFIASLSYTATDALLNLTATLGEQPPGDPPPLGGGLNVTRQNVATSLNTFFNSGGALPPNFVNVFGLTGSALGTALSQLSGEPGTGAQAAGFKLTDMFLALMLDPFAEGRESGLGAEFAVARDTAAALPLKAAASRMNASSFEARWTGWAAGYGGSNRTNGNAVTGSHDLTSRVSGYAGGLDYRITQDTAMGFALAGAGTNWGLSDGLGGGRSDAAQAGAYGVTRSGPTYLSMALAYTWHRMSTDRVAFAGNRLTADFNAQNLGARAEAGYRFGFGSAGITSYAALQVQNLGTPSYAETDVNGGSFALAYAHRSATDTRSELGARLDHRIPLDNNAVLALRGRVAWAHHWVSDPTLSATFQALPGASFIVNGAQPAQNSALLSAGAELRLATGVSFNGKFDGEFANRSNTYAGTGSVRVRW